MKPINGRFIDMTGQRFNRLKVIKYFGVKNKRSMWLCQCNCKNKTLFVANAVTLRNGKTRSCGCLRKETSSRTFTTHGMTGTPTYITWKAMIARCSNTKNVRAKDYAGRGITVCKRWLKFENFYIDMGLKPSRKHSLDRKNNNGNYCKSNCRWATRKQQNNNTRRNRRIKYKGQTKTMSEWCKTLNLSRGAVSGRLKLGWTIKETFETPLGVKLLGRRTSQSHCLTHNGKTMTISEWSRHTGLPFYVISSRIKCGWPVEDVLTQPASKQKRHKKKEA